MQPTLRTLTTLIHEMPSMVARIDSSRANQLVGKAPKPSSHHHSSKTASAVIGFIVPLVALVYFFGLFLLYKYARKHPRPVNKESGVRLQKYGPGKPHARLLPLSPFAATKGEGHS